MKKRFRRMLGGLVYARLMDAIDLDKLLDLEATLLAHSAGEGEPDIEDDPALNAETVAGLVRREWRNLGRQVIGRLGEGDILPRH